ncbi:hypothetical protein [Cryobacterium sp. N19]|uniref:hypothetical protein n=1 Tax=Cryobacterium sp. N19 TaxID=2048288 RepID=UPI000CE50D88|nr:hypothetical protein [Cryobacterium sp. N19]
MNPETTVTPPTPAKKTSTVATWPRIARGVLSDLIGWVIPWVVIALAIGLIPPISESVGWKVLLILIAATWSAINIAVDAESLRKNGWTWGFAKTGLFVVDPKKDHIKHLARHRKSIRKLFHGDYYIGDGGKPNRKA